MKPQLGQAARDIVTGFTGLVMAHAQFFTGCDQVLLTPRELDKDGKRREGEWFDETRIVAVDAAVLVLPTPAKEAVVKPGADEPSAPWK